MSEFNKLGIVINYEFLKHIRRARLWVILGIALLADALVLILIPVLQDGYPDSVLTMAALMTVGPTFAVLGAVFFAGDAIAGEYENKTGFMLFTNPIKKITLWTGKYLAGYIAVTLLIIFTYIITVVSLLVIYGEVPFDTLKSWGLAQLYGAAVLSVTFFFSSISKGSMGATIITLVFIWVISGIVQSVLAFTGNPYWYLISAQGDSISMVYGGLDAFMGGFGGGEGFGNMFDYEIPTIAESAWGMVIYLVLGFGLSIWIAGRRQLA
ncbi:MAG TPA: ABC transporter permease [Spirochaetes bacterium]|nr:ABC transporter permease [Spirochaetota bacterium]